MSRRRPAAEIPETTCAWCRKRPAHRSFLCGWCGDLLHGHLASLADDVRELELELMLLARKGRSRGYTAPVSRSHPLPYSVPASEILGAYRAVLVSAVRVVALDQSDVMPADDLISICEWLAANEPSLVMRAEVGDIATEIVNIRERCRRCIDTPAERVYIGLCECSTEALPVPIYAVRGEARHRCRSCAREYVVADVLAAREQAARDYLLTATEVEQVTGGRIKRGRVYVWVNRGQLAQDGERRVRFGDVLNLEARRVAGVA